MRAFNPRARAGFTGTAAAGLVVLALLAPRTTHAQLAVTDSSRNISLTLGTWIQPRYEFLDPGTGENLSSFHLRRARFNMVGTALLPQLRFQVQAELVRSATILDAYLEWRFSPAATLRFGQGFAPFHFLVSPSRSQFAEAALGYHTPGLRQAGLSLTGRPAGGRLFYFGGVFDGASLQARRSNSSGHLVSFRGSAALSGTVPTEEADLLRQAQRVLAVGAGFQAANKNELQDWSLGRSEQRRGDWSTVVGDVQFQHQGFTLQGEYFHRWVQPADTRLADYTGDAWAVAVGYTLAPGRLPPVGLAFRHSLQNPHRNSAQGGASLFREVQTDGAVTVYHRGHNLKTRLGLSHRKADLPAAAARVALTVDTHLMF